MAEKRTLTKRQMSVLDDLLSGELDDEKVFEKHRISPNTYRKWLSDDSFTSELNFRMKTARLKSQLIIARYAQVAAMKLVELTGSDKEETARKACLDVISVPIDAGRLTDKERLSQDQQRYEQLTPALASRMLMVLAQTDNNITGERS